MSLHVGLKRRVKGWRDITAGAPEGFVFALILVNTFVSNLCRNISKLHLSVPNDKSNVI